MNDVTQQIVRKTQVINPDEYIWFLHYNEDDSTVFANLLILSEPLVVRNSVIKVNVREPSSIDYIKLKLSCQI